MDLIHLGTDCRACKYQNSEKSTFSLKQLLRKWLAIVRGIRQHDFKLQKKTLILIRPSLCILIHSYAFCEKKVLPLSLRNYYNLTNVFPVVLRKSRMPPDCGSYCGRTSSTWT